MGKPKATPKAKAGAADAKKAAEAEEAAASAAAREVWKKRKEATLWAQGQLSALASQRDAAAKSEAAAWMADPHQWHEAQLAKVVKCLEGKLLDVIPQDMREGIEAYVSQCAEGGGEEVKASFQEHREIYAELPDVETAYFRAPETAAFERCIAEIKVWDDVEPEPMDQFATVFFSPATSAGVYEAALAKLGGLLFQHTSESGKRKSGAEGLKASTLMPHVAAALRKYVRDADVQRRGCAVIRGFALMEGQLTPMLQEGGAKLAVDAVNAHPRNADVVKTGTAAMEAMALKAEPMDFAIMKEAGVHHERK